MTKYLVYRYGSNTANQPSCWKMPICIVEAKNKTQAKELAEKTHIFYENQSAEAIAESKARQKDWDSVVMSEGMAHLSECEPLADGVLYTSEPRINYNYSDEVTDASQN